MLVCLLLHPAVGDDGSMMAADAEPSATPTRSLRTRRHAASCYTGAAARLWRLAFKQAVVAGLTTIAC